jgi:hypothetical protein
MTDQGAMRVAYLNALHQGLATAEEDLRALLGVARVLLERGDLSTEDYDELQARITACESLG